MVAQKSQSFSSRLLQAMKGESERTRSQGSVWSMKSGYFQFIILVFSTGYHTGFQSVGLRKCIIYTQVYLLSSIY